VSDRVAVVVPTYRRPEALAACLGALAGQLRAPDEVVVAARSDDDDARRVAECAPLRCKFVVVDEPGVLAAMVAGVRATTAPIICFTDDDAVAPPEWLDRLVATIQSSDLIGAAGGRDVLIDPDGSPRDEPLTSEVGQLRAYGRHVGHHHRGAGAARDVAFLKGVNAAYRRQALALPVGLRGTGAQVHFEVAVGRWATSRGWRLVYDPSITVEHHPAPRVGDDQRDAPARQAVCDAAYNLVVALGGWRGLARLAYAVVLGDRGCPGVLRAAAALATGDRATARKLVPAVRGSMAGALAVATGRRVRYVTF